MKYLLSIMKIVYLNIGSRYFPNCKAEGYFLCYENIIVLGSDEFQNMQSKVLKEGLIVETSQGFSETRPTWRLGILAASALKYKFIHMAMENLIRLIHLVITFIFSCFFLIFLAFTFQMFLFSLSWKALNS